MNPFTRLYAIYEKGGITDTELNLMLMQAVTEENVGQIEELSPGYLRVIRNYLRRQPAADEEWDKVRFFGIVMWGRNVTAEYVDNYWKEQARKHRNGVEILRRYFKEVEMGAFYHSLIITASNPSKDIWLSDDGGNLVQRGHGVLTTELLAGTYKVRFGLEGEDHTIELKEATQYHEEDE